MCMKLSFHAQCPKRFLIGTEARGTVERIELGGIHLFESTCRSDMSQGVCSTSTNYNGLQAADADVRSRDGHRLAQPF